jgi:hypothetical protein
MIPSLFRFFFFFLIVNNIMEQIGAISGLVGKKIKDKLQDILTKNKEFTKIY